MKNLKHDFGLRIVNLIRQEIVVIAVKAKASAAEMMERERGVADARAFGTE